MVIALQIVVGCDDQAPSHQFCLCVMSMWQFLPQVVKQPIFLSFPKFPKNLINSLGHIFVKYVKNLPCIVQKQSKNIHFPILFRKTLCEGSAIYIFLIALKIFGHSFLSKPLPHDKIQLHLPSKSSLANFQSFCPPRSIVKEVPFLYIEMT